MKEPIASGSTRGLQVGRQALIFITNLSVVDDVKEYNSSSQPLNVPVGVNVQRVGIFLFKSQGYTGHSSSFSS